jgi:hypothetical protein
MSINHVHRLERTATYESTVVFPERPDWSEERYVIEAKLETEESLGFAKTTLTEKPIIERTSGKVSVTLKMDEHALTIWETEDPR